MRAPRADPDRSSQAVSASPKGSGRSDVASSSVQGAEIRVLDVPDAEAYRALRLQALERVPHAFGASAEEYRSEPLEAVRQGLLPQPEGDFTVGAFLSGRLVGIASFTRYDALKLRHRGHIGSVYVDEAVRGQGIGQALLEALIARVRRYGGLEHVSLVVMSKQAAAQCLYRRLGFRTSCKERRTMKVGDRYLDQEQMVLGLEPRS